MSVSMSGDWQTFVSLKWFVDVQWTFLYLQYNALQYGGHYLRHRAAWSSTINVELVHLVEGSATNPVIILCSLPKVNDVTPVHTINWIDGETVALWANESALRLSVCVLQINSVFVTSQTGRSLSNTTTTFKAFLHLLQICTVKPIDRIVGVNSCAV